MKKITIPLIIIVIALIILPTGTPEDIVTTLPLIGAIGMPSFILLCAGILGLLYVTGLLNRLARMVRLPPRTLIILLALLTLIYLVVIT